MGFLGLLQTVYAGGQPDPKNFAEAEALQRAALGDAFPALTNADWERFTRAIYTTSDGGVRPDHDLNLLKTLEGIDFAQELPDLWAQFDLFAELPLLLIRGENTRLLAPETVAEMTRRHPACQVINVAGQGHAPLLETGQLPELIAAFVAGVDLRVV